MDSPGMIQGYIYLCIKNIYLDKECEWRINGILKRDIKSQDIKEDQKQGTMIK